jgi:hypothetical protein
MSEIATITKEDASFLTLRLIDWQNFKVSKHTSALTSRVKLSTLLRQFFSEQEGTKNLRIISNCLTIERKAL